MYPLHSDNITVGQLYDMILQLRRETEISLQNIDERNFSPAFWQKICRLLGGSEEQA